MWLGFHICDLFNTEPVYSLHEARLGYGLEEEQKTGASSEELLSDLVTWNRSFHTSVPGSQAYEMYTLLPFLQEWGDPWFFTTSLSRAPCLCTCPHSHCGHLFISLSSFYPLHYSCITFYISDCSGYLVSPCNRLWGTLVWGPCFSQNISWHLIYTLGNLGIST